MAVAVLEPEMAAHYKSMERLAREQPGESWVYPYQQLAANLCRIAHLVWPVWPGQDPNAYVDGSSDYRTGRATRTSAADAIQQWVEAEVQAIEGDRQLAGRTSGDRATHLREDAPAPEPRRESPSARDPGRQDAHAGDELAPRAS
jgi:hypothetical protein